MANMAMTEQTPKTMPRTVSKERRRWSQRLRMPRRMARWRRVREKPLDRTDGGEGLRVIRKIQASTTNLQKNSKRQIPISYDRYLCGKRQRASSPQPSPPQEEREKAGNFALQVFNV